MPSDRPKPPRCGFILILIVAGLSAAQVPAQQPPSPLNAVTETAPEMVAASQLTEALSIAEWLGPMAPVALSPFFGIMCLSALSLFGAGWMAPGNPLLGAGSPLHNPLVLVVFAVLTGLTTIPRMTKVSKPFAQAMDQLETWAGVITMILLRVLVSGPTAPAQAVAVVHAGGFSASGEVLLTLAAGLNVVVISAVRFFFEILVWLTPVPFLDAVFDLANKSTCVVLMAIYAWDPAVALIINISLFCLCAVVFAWVRRREVFYRTLVFDRLRTLIKRPRLPDSLIVFPEQSIGAIPRRARCRFRRSRPGTWILTCERWLRPELTETLSSQETPVFRAGLISDSIGFGNPAAELTCSVAYRHAASAMLEQFGVRVENIPDAQVSRAVGTA